MHTRKFGSGTEMGRILFLSVVFSVMLVAARIARTHSLLYVSLIWNLFLAWIPYGISLLMTKKESWFRSPPAFFGTVAVWLLFFPNAPYIITDLFHLKQQPGVPLWYDLMLIFSFAWNGLILGYLSLMKTEREISRRLGPLLTRGFVVAVIALGAYGVFLGRYLRWNSWDMFTNPFGLVLKMGYMATHPLDFTGAWGMTLLLAILTGIMYLTLKKLAQGTGFSRRDAA